MENKNILNDKELQQVNGGMVPFLEDVSGSEIKVEKLVLDSWDETTRIPDDNNGKIVIG